ncbi:hypothetical protein [Aquimarina longa]|uniref:hypothetical protein n=1 Tax=Aquimarina longa TaxID=1080221 RepID=UPI000A6484D0|nr:hypothetical protein [Aquimarina longa]
MKKNKFSTIGFNLLMASGAILLLIFFSKYKFDWLYYLAGVLAIIGVIISFIGKRKNKV